MRPECNFAVSSRRGSRGPSFSRHNEKYQSKSKANGTDREAEEYSRTLPAQHISRDQEEHVLVMLPSGAGAQPDRPRFASKALGTDFALSHIPQDNRAGHHSLQEYVEAEQHPSRPSMMSEGNQGAGGDGDSTPAPKKQLPKRKDLHTQVLMSGETEMKEMSLNDGASSQLDNKPAAKAQGSNFVDIKKVSIGFQQSNSTGRSPQNAGKTARASKGAKQNLSRDEVMK